MARGRMIDKRIGMSKKLGRISDKAKVLWFMLYPHLDCEGRITFDDLEDLKDEIIPKFKSWSPKKIGDTLNELADIGLIRLYPNKNKIAMQFERFEDFQSGMRKDRESPTTIVAPPNSGVFRITPALSLSLSTSIKKEGSNKNTEKEFDVFWNIYNLKIAKKDALNAFKSLRGKDISFDTIKEAVKGYANHLKNERDGGFDKKQMYPATFLRNEKWNDFIGVKYEPPL